MSHVIVAFIALDIGFILGWCVRVALTRENLALLDAEREQPLIARWE